MFERLPRVPCHTASCVDWVALFVIRWHEYWVDVKRKRAEREENRGNTGACLHLDEHEPKLNLTSKMCVKEPVLHSWFRLCFNYDSKVFQKEVNNLIILSLSLWRLSLFSSFVVFFTFFFLFKRIRWVFTHTHEIPPPDTITFMQTRGSLLAHFTRGVGGAVGWHRCPTIQRAHARSTRPILCWLELPARTNQGKKSRFITTYWCDVMKYTRGLIKNVPKEQLKRMLVAFGA